MLNDILGDVFLIHKTEETIQFDYVSTLLV